MAPIGFFQTRVSDFFTQLAVSGTASLSGLFLKSFPLKQEYTPPNITFLLAYASHPATTEKVAKAFSLALPTPVLNYIIKRHGIAECSEQVRAYLLLRDSKKDPTEHVSTLIGMMNTKKINTEKLRYRFACRIAALDPSTLLDEMNEFEFIDKSLSRRLAELVLYFDAEALLTNLNEFKFDEMERREFFLRGLARSSSIMTKLQEDPFFSEDLENIPPEILTYIYKKFRFGEKFIKDLIDKNKIPLDEPSLFTLLVKKAGSPPELQTQLGTQDVDLFNQLEEAELGALLAMLILFQSLPNPTSFIQDKNGQDFLSEIKKFRDPGVRFGMVALLLAGKKMGNPIASQLGFQTDPDKGPSCTRFYSMAHSTCKILCPKLDPNTILGKKWKNLLFQKAFLQFLTELCLSERISFQDQQKILQKLFEKEELQSTEAFADATLCIVSRLHKPLLLGSKPREILSAQMDPLLDRLGAPLGCVGILPPKLRDELKHTQEISHYAQGLLRLPEDEKNLMVPFFFRFLKLTAEKKMEEERFKTPELETLFKNNPCLNRQAWQKKDESTVSALLKGTPSSTDTPKLNVREGLNSAFDQNHLDRLRYARLYEHLRNPGVTPPLLDGQTFEKHRTSENAKDNDLAWMHLLSKLLMAKDRNDQFPLIGELVRIFPKSSDFGVDLRKWNESLQIQKNYENYKIIRSHDPYILFLIGSVAGESCQRVSGDPEKNKCLLAYPCDGKNQVIYAENPEGTIKARAIIRFFYAGNNTQKPGEPYLEPVHPQKPDDMRFPVLYLEPVYPSGAPGRLREAITAFAIQCAEEVGVPLVRTFIDRKPGDKDYPCRLETINGPAPFEYFDGTEMKVKPNNTYNDSMGASRTTTFCIEGSRVQLLTKKG